VRPLLLAIPLLAFAGDALAWGLQTHLFFAQHVLLAAPLLDPDLRRAALRFPRLVLGGACLPDLALAGAALGVRVFRRNHHWPCAHRLAAAGCDEERAVALGYASHLVSDVVAHNRFVPEHERRVADVAHVTLAAIVGRRWRCGEALALRVIDWLSGADRMLRCARVPRLARGLLRLIDRRLAPRFDAYVRETSALLAQVGAVLEGARPAADPDPSRPLRPASAARTPLPQAPR
jgi:hypothetical protein